MHCSSHSEEGTEYMKTTELIITIMGTTIIIIIIISDIEIR